MKDFVNYTVKLRYKGPAHNAQKPVPLDFQAFFRVFCLAYNAPFILPTTHFFTVFFTFFQGKI